MSAYTIDSTELDEAYNINAIKLEGVYYLSGEYSSFEKQEAIPLDYSEYSITNLFATDVLKSGVNGFDVHNNIIAQLKADNAMYLFDLINQTVIAAALTITSAHGDSASFSHEKYLANDEFPLLYITSDANPAVVYVNRITRSGAALIKTLSFPLNEAGYYAAHAYDEENQIMYMVGYTQQNYTSSNNGANKTLISKWDMTQLSQNQDGSFTPEYVSALEIPFIYCTQGQQFFDGMIWASSGYNNGLTQYIYAINPSTGEILYTIQLNDTYEVEGLSWVYDNVANKYWMLVGQQNVGTNYNYYRIDFTPLNEVT